MANRTALFSRKQPGGVFTVHDVVQHPGDIWFVDSTNTSASDSAGYGRNPDAPFATIDYAFSQATASQGDVIYLMPGHAETLDAATDFVVDVAGIKVIGLGQGALRPTFTYSTTDSILSVTAASTWIENIVLAGNVDNIVTGISLAATADGCTLKNIEMKDGATNKEFLIGISVAAACTDVTIDGLAFHGLAGGMTDCILLVGAADRFKLLNSYIYCDASDKIVDGSAAASAGVVVANNLLINVDTGAGLGVAFHNSSTGFVANNRMWNNKDTVAGFSGAGLAYAENYASNAAGAQGILVPAADS